METTIKQANVDNYLVEYKDRALAALANGNQMGAAYLACLGGMWTNACRQPHINPFVDDNTILYRWFANGYDDYSAAIKISAEVRAKQLKAEERDDAKRASKKNKSTTEPSTSGKSGFWSKKFW